MNDYIKTDFHHYFDKELNIRRYYLKVQGAFIEVNKDVYYTCYNSYRKQIRDNRRDQKYGLFSYDSVQLDGHNVSDTFGLEYDPVDKLYKKDVLKAIMHLIEALDDKDKELISELLIEEKKESELARKYKVSQQTINRRKRRIMKTLQKKISSSCKKIKTLLFILLCILLNVFEK